MASGSISAIIKYSQVKNNLTTTAAGGVLDARQGKALNDKIAALSTKGTWTPQIYDLNTYKFSLSSQTYWKIGPLYFCYISATLSAVTFSTMMQIRNLPCAASIGGTIYIARASGEGGDKTFQATSGHNVYIRPNITGSLTGGGIITALIIGVD